MTTDEHWAEMMLMKHTEEKMKEKTIADMIGNGQLTPKIDVEGWIRWDGAAHSPVPPRTVVETLGLNGDYKGPAGMIVNWQKIKKYRVVSRPEGGESYLDYWGTSQAEKVKEYGRTHEFPLNGRPPLVTQPAPSATKQLLESKLKATKQLLESKLKANDIQEGGTHYKDMKIQVWDVIDTWPIEHQIGFYRGNILKYTMRMGSKDMWLVEAKKAAHYAQKLVEVLSK